MIMSEDEFTRLFKYMQAEFKSVHEELAQTAKKDSLNQLVETLDAFLKRVEDAEVNDVARDAQIARMERWIETIAQKTGVKLEY